MFIRTISTIILLSSVSVSGFSREAFVERSNGPSGALSGRVIAVCPSHGRYYEQGLDRWEWQRGRLHGTVEDLFSTSFVYPFLTPMLENAGAYVVMPRERDRSAHELIIDPDGEYAIDGYREQPARHHDKKYRWTDSDRPGFGYTAPILVQGQNPFAAGGARVARATADKERAVGASWSASIPESGEYAVYVSYQSGPESCRQVHYTVNTAAGPELFTVDQSKGGGTWIYLGTFPFRKDRGSTPLVELTSYSGAEGVVCADAVKIGGGMGNVARGSRSLPEEHISASGMPRFAEAARYWLQWAGMPDSIYSNTGGESDYKDDIFARPMWVNYLKNELGIPVDMMLSFHTDAGLTESPDETVGTMGIFYTNRGAKFPDGRSRRLNRALADSIVTSVVRDVRAKHAPDWTRRKMRDKSYVEIRIPEVPSMLIELLSHQNYADMIHGLDPSFRFDVSRAIYKGILAYMSAQKQVRYVVQPLPVSDFAIQRRKLASSPSQLTLTWSATPDPLEPTAIPMAYRVEERIGGADEPFRFLAEVSEPTLDVELVPGQIQSYRVVAVNSGGRSFPSEVLCAGYQVRSATDWVTVVNGFTRVSGPDAFYSGDYAGFGLADAGVPWGTDTYATGRCYEFNRSAPWADDDNPGFGASGWELEGKTIKGNSFDHVLAHGEALMACGRSFVSTSASAFCADSLSTPPIVDVMFGMQRNGSFTEEMRRRLTALSGRGTDLIVSGAYVGTDLRTEVERAFASDLLGYSFRGPVYGDPNGVNEVPSQYFQNFHGGFFAMDAGAEASPYRMSGTDAITSVSGPGHPAVVMRYNVSMMPAAVALRADRYGAVTLGFPFEAIEGEASRAKLMSQILEFLK